MRRLFVIFYICFSTLVYAQNNIYKFKHLSTLEGLSQNSAVAINQDDLGQIWIGTRDGLNKYDGSELTVYRREQNNPNSISSNDILCIESASSGYLWIGTHLGLNRYDLKTNTFKRYFTDNKKDNSLLDNVIWTIKEMSNGELWVGTPKGLSILDKSKDFFYNIPLVTQVYAITETKKGEIFIGTKDGLKKIIPTSEKSYEIKALQSTKDLIIQDVLEIPNGDLLLGTKSKSVLSFNVKSEVVSPYFKEKTIKDINKNIKKLVLDNEGELWIGTYNGLQIADKNKKVKALYHNVNYAESISDNSIRAIFKDRKGSIWVGTYYGGVNFWDHSNTNFINIFRRPGNSGLSFKAVSALAKHKKFIFLGTEGGGITILDTKNKRYNYIDVKNTPELKSDNVKSLYFKDGYLWIGTFDKGLFVYNWSDKKVEPNYLPERVQSFLKAESVQAITQDKNGNVWVATTTSGMCKFNISNGSFQIWDSTSTTTQNILSDYVRFLKIDFKNNVWVGTFKGLNLINVNGKIQRFFYDENLDAGYVSNAVFEDSKGQIWVGTESNGLFKFVENKFIPIELIANKESITGIRSIIEDDEGNFWIGTSNKGIVYYNPNKKFVIKDYSLRDGLVGNQFSNNASLKVGRSHYLFGGQSGAVLFDSKNIVKNDYNPQVILTDFKIKNNSISVNDNTDILTQAIAFTKDINLSYLQGNFSIEFSIPNFINSGHNKYLYRLKGLEEDWVETDLNSVSYTIQNPGNYVFEVKGVNNDGYINNTPTTLNIRVNPAPWRTWWAFTLYGLFFFLVMYYLLHILKSKAALKNQLDLEYAEAEQIKSANKAKLEFFTNISHEFRTPLTLILGPLNQILDNYKGSSSMYKKLKVIEGSANHLLQLINRLMDFRKLENNLMTLESAEGNIVKFLKEIYLSFSEYAKDGNYDYTLEAPESEILVYYDRYKLERVLYNLISNAFRYTPKGGKIVLRIFREDTNVIIQVEDSGVGIADEYKDKIFERFFELSINNKPDNNYNRGTGIGLSIVKNIVDLHKGEISVSNNQNNHGSIFSVTLPLGKDHLEPSEILQDFKFSDDLSQYVEQLEQPEAFLEEDLLEDLVLEEKPTILLVEDNKPLRKFMKGLLKKDYNIVEAENGKIAFKIAINDPIDIIISDVVMPELTGTELCSLIKQDIRTSHIPVILLTSRSSLIYKIDGLESGADDYISKPFNLLEFKLRIKNILHTVTKLKNRLNASETFNSDDIVLSSLDEKLYKKALQIVDDNIGNEQFDIPSFCEELGVSRTVLFKKVKAWTGFTPKDFIQNIRLNRGARLLEQGKLNISQVSYALGFKNPKYFSKCFRKKFGKTPTEYIKTFSE